VQTDPPLELKPKFCILTAPAPQVAQLFSPFAESLQTISYFSQWVLASFFDPAFNPSSLFHAQTPEYDSHPLGSLGSIASIVRLHPLILQSEKSLQDWHKENPAPEMQEAQKLILESYPKALLSSHTWRYSQPVRSLLSDFLMIPGLPIFAAGDSFGNSVYPLERSLSSAFATTQAIINLFSHT
jgi:predicted NAD/FAD-dependent oxidoreductase